MRNLNKVWPWIKALQGLFIDGFSTLDFITLVVRSSLFFRSGEGNYHSDSFPAFRGTEESQRALPNPAATQVILV